MKSLLNKLSTSIQPEMIEFNRTFKTSLNSEVKLINTVIGYISRKKGKQLRPRLCLLSAKMCGEITPLTYKAAALIEMIHVATLIHDDVVDEADLRRGWPSVNRIWKNKISILVGDFMFSKALSNMITLRNFDALEILSSTAERLSQGEILQIEKALKKEMTEGIYYRMVRDKTASLFSASCQIGAITTNASVEQQKAMAIFGEKLGIAFQIRDDLFDIMGTVDAIGKPIGFDVKKNMLTLPLIHMFETVGNNQKKSIQRKLKQYASWKDILSIRKLVKKHGGIDYATQQMERISNEAMDALNIFPDSEYKDALIDAVKFNLGRES
ncbi:MAG: polyprenyl synthetase family protein [Candidatus Marinimicrobia bacterium]|nr:polyprenyl synthetase family protein [Candidatus Neomarinimicrobiota bacterium]